MVVNSAVFNPSRPSVPYTSFDQSTIADLHMSLRSAAGGKVQSESRVVNASAHGESDGTRLCPPLRSALRGGWVAVTDGAIERSH